MRLARSRLTISWAILSIFFGVISAHANRDDCAISFRTIATTRSAQPSFRALKSDLPEIPDPLRFIEDFRAQRSAWNRANPRNLNNFSVPQLQNGVDRTKTLLREVIDAVPASVNRADAQMYLRELEKLEARKLPYRDTVLMIHEAVEVVAFHTPNPGVSPRLKFDRAQYLKDNGQDRVEFAAAMSHEIFITTGHPQSVEGLAESSLVGIRALEVVRNPKEVHGKWMNARHRFEHDVAHAIVVPQIDRLSREILQLPFETRVDILRSVENLSEREAHLARFTIYRMAHEYAAESAIPISSQASSISQIQREYRADTGKEISADEVRWIQEWFKDTIGRRLFEQQNPI